VKYKAVISKAMSQVCIWLYIHF